ncbi:Hpt domain-containing protein [Phenylobacterium sp. J367]|uniref:Hpt domain-containing protein n=1 Tax=Phenylobacterium sp. J367 TaxID=2898435 RepID=UPI0035AE94D5
MEEIKATFFQECEEQLAELESGLMAMDEGDHGSETVNAVFRAVHSVKGGAGAFGLDDLVRFAHVFETTLDQVRSEKLAPTPDLMKVMLRSADVLTDLVRAARDGGTVDEARCEELAGELKAFVGGEAVVDDDDGMGDLDFQPLAAFDAAPVVAAPASGGGLERALQAAGRPLRQGQRDRPAAARAVAPGPGGGRTRRLRPAAAAAPRSGGLVPLLDRPPDRRRHRDRRARGLRMGRRRLRAGRAPGRRRRRG